MFSDLLRSVTPSPVKKTARKVQSSLKNFELKNVPKRLNDYTLAIEPLPPSVFRAAKAKPVSSSSPEIRDAFQWTLHDTDGRGATYQEWQAEESVKRWLMGKWYQPYHFVWKRPDDDLVAELESKITALGHKTWQRMFRRYWFNHLKGHDSYSLPDVYYCCTTLGRVPDVALDIGGGWGRLAMAWSAVGCKSVAIVDSIEQPYILQNLYSRSIPGVAFQELLDRDVLEIDLNAFTGVSHFPLWKLPLVRPQTVDIVSTIQVLREVSHSMVFFLVEQLKRVLRPGGIFYVRENDHAYPEACMHDVKVTEYLCEQGFQLVLSSSLVQGRDIHGVPRIFQWKA
jgi:hypothetical protein